MKKFIIKNRNFEKLIGEESISINGNKSYFCDIENGYEVMGYEVIDNKHISYDFNLYKDIDIEDIKQNFKYLGFEIEHIDESVIIEKIEIIKEELLSYINNEEDFRVALQFIDGWRYNNR